MRIDKLTVQNFRGFKERTFEFRPGFNLLVGENGSGKTSVLEALSIAIGVWPYCIRHTHMNDLSLFFGHDVLKDNVRVQIDEVGGEMEERSQFPNSIKAEGLILGHSFLWEVKKRNELGCDLDFAGIEELALGTRMSVSKFEKIALPLLAYYGTERLWPEPRMNGGPEEYEKKPHPFKAYEDCLNARCNPRDLVRWLGRQEWIKFQEKETPAFPVVRQAILGCLEGGKNISFKAKEERVLIEIEGQGWRWFGNLSDGQRNMVAMVGDIARKAAVLNSHLNDAILTETSGVVLIDELDLHLHPKWQRRVIEDLRRTFPKIQFIATTHSPFLIQTVRQGELIALDDRPLGDYENRGLEEVTVKAMGVTDPNITPRYAEMLDVAKQYYRMLEEAQGANQERLRALKAQLDSMIAPYADNPAYQAFLEMHRTAAFREGGAR
ncbi:MAG: AAA family ATPase [Candidatus Sumerlaeota bacterium]|nr:AAA family ATPase [Candidatus Sumerlaeota bacterium]